MKLNVRRQKTRMAKTIDLLFVLVPLSLVGVSALQFVYDGDFLARAKASYGFLVLLIGGTVLFVTIRHFRLQQAVSTRKKRLQSAADQLNMVPVRGDYRLLSYTLASIGKRRLAIEQAYVASDWQFFDYRYSVFQKHKDQEYEAAKLYFAVASFDLPRALPNVFFDSLDSGKKEFKRYFDSSQRHSLEGDFDSHFDTYFNKGYEIDSLSFITPEVMEAMVYASHYDIEIFGNKLYLISELEHMPRQLEDMHTHGFAVRKMLLNNILTYRDERLPMSVGRLTVSLKGLTLKRSLMKYRLEIALGLLFGLGSFVPLLFGKELYAGLLMAGFLAAFHGWDALRKKDLSN